MESEFNQIVYTPNVVGFKALKAADEIDRPRCVNDRRYSRANGCVGICSKSEIIFAKSGCKGAKFDWRAMVPRGRLFALSEAGQYSLVGGCVVWSSDQANHFMN